MNDYAVIKTGGKQYLVEQGTKINVEKLEQIGKICFQNTKTIQDVLLFLNNVKDHYNFNQ